MIYRAVAMVLTLGLFSGTANATCSDRGIAMTEETSFAEFLDQRLGAVQENSAE